MFANLPISRKLLVAFATVVAAIFVSSAILYDRLRGGLERIAVG